MEVHSFLRNCAKRASFRTAWELSKYREKFQKFYGIPQEKSETKWGRHCHEVAPHAPAAPAPRLYLNSIIWAGCGEAFYSKTNLDAYVVSTIKWQEYLYVLFVLLIILLIRTLIEFPAQYMLFYFICIGEQIKTNNI